MDLGDSMTTKILFFVSHNSSGHFLFHFYLLRLLLSRVFFLPYFPIHSSHLIVECHPTPGLLGQCGNSMYGCLTYEICVKMLWGRRNIGKKSFLSLVYFPLLAENNLITLKKKGCKKV